MAIKTRGVSTEDGHVMTAEEFKRWLKKFDSDRDGRISREELQDAIRFTGGLFSMWKQRRAVNAADADGNGFIDDDEMNNLVEFAQKTLGVKIVAF
ncbi:hypothetical protein MLD38_001761 [Melastoma candidum]|uniref:Uncharacterized protein n=1 Tax=Melastoma candidum TaxID=119954 RepID=A0ACB9SG92_9MYRT|nr:hypothetical protein MLD38_001761 [Melastoma candidum]